MNRSVSVALALLAYASACGSGPTQAPQAPVASAGPSRAAPSPPPAPSAGAGTATTPAVPPSPAEQQHWRTVQALAAAVDGHDLERIAAAYAPDAELTVIPGAGVLRGSEAIAADQQPFFQAFPDYRFAVVRAWVPPDALIAEQVGFGTNTGDFLGMKATGRRAGQRSLAIYWFSKDGRVAREHLYEDGATLLAQLAGQPAAQPVPTGPPPPKVFFAAGDEHANEALAVARAYIDAASRKDVAKMTSLLADDVEMDLAVAPVPEKGKEQAVQSFERFAATFPDARWDVSNGWGVGDYAILEFAIQATQDGPIGPLPATHRKVDWHWARVFQVRGGKIVRGWAYANTIELMGELGALGSARAPSRSPSHAPAPASPASSHAPLPVPAPATVRP